MRTYGIFLRLFPRRFRERFGRDMEEVFAGRLADAGSATARLGVWFGAVLDVVRHAPPEWLAEVRSRERSGTIVEGFAGFGRDVRFAIRGLRRSPGVSALAIGTLALGIGATTAVFGAVYGLMLRPLPYADAERLVSVWPETNFNTTMVERVAEAVPALSGISGVSQWTLSLVDPGFEPIEIDGLFVSPGHFDLLGVRPLLGRTFEAADGAPGAGAVTILSWDLWQNRYGGDPDILGRTIRLAGGDYDARQVIGVMPRGYRAVVGPPAVWVPLERRDATLATDNTWWVTYRVGRLAPGATKEQAEQQLARIAPVLRAEVPNILDEESVRAPSLPSLREETIAPLRGSVAVLAGAVGLVLLIACVNVANLLLARGVARLPELRLQRALGAGRGRIVRQMLTEALVLAAAGTFGGLLLARVLGALLVAMAPPNLRDLQEGMPLAVAGFAVGLSFLSVLFFGVAPAVRAGASVARAGRGAVGARSGRLTAGLVALEVALAIMLVAASGLMLRTLRNLHDVDAGFSTDGVLAFRPAPAGARYGDGPAYHRYFEALLERVRAVPGVASAGGVQILPVSNNNWSFPLYIDGHDVPSGGSPPTVNVRLITPGYLETLRIPVVRGRDITAADRLDNVRVALVNEAFARRFWPDGEGMGKRFRMFGRGEPAYAVVGMVGDIRQRALDRPAVPEVYVPHQQVPWEASLSLVVRSTNGDPSALGPALRDAVWSVDPEVPISGMEPLSRAVGRSAATTRFLTVLLAGFGGLALLLGAVGVYGVTAFTVARRLPEFGVRRALGASTPGILGSAFGRGLLPVALGVAGGVGGALAGTRLLRGLLFEVEPGDPVTLGAATLLLALFAVTALIVPALRATRVDPLEVLRRE